MKFLNLVLIFLSLAFITSCATSGSKFKLREYKEVQLENGLNLLLIPDKKLPSFSMIMLVKTGSAWDPDSHQGLANMVGGLLKKGTTKKSAIEIADSLGQVGAEFHASVSSDYTILSGNSLSTHSGVLLEEMSSIVMQPAFRKSEVSRYQAQILSALKRTVDNPGAFASNAFNKYLYSSHQYGHSPIGTTQGVKKIKRKDIIRFYRRYYRPNNAVMAIVGDFDEAMVEKVKQRFSQWGRRDVKSIEYAKVPPISGRQISLIHKPGLTQSRILFGHMGIRRQDPDYVTLKVANSILGKGFTSRLVSEIRVKRGLTYSISSYFIPRKDRGPFTISTFSRNDKVGETVKETLNVFEQFYKTGVTKEEVESAKAYLKGVFPRILETSESTAENLLILRHYNVPDSYLTTFLKRVDKISVSDVNRAIKKHFDPDNLKILVYSQKKVNSQLKDIGQLKMNSYKERSL